MAGTFQFSQTGFTARKGKGKAIVAMADGVMRLVPKNNGMVHAVKWTGSAKCLVGMPEFDDIVCRILRIDQRGLLVIELERGETQVRPYKDYVVVNALSVVEVWQEEFLQKYYSSIPDGPVSRDVFRNLRLDGHMGDTITVIEADRPDGT